MAIDVKSQLVHLSVLQELDLRLHKLIEKIDAVPNQKAEILSEVNIVKDEMVALTAEKEANEKEKRDIEAVVADATEHLKTFESKLYSIKTNKEYQAALKEISEIKKSNREKDDRDLQLMELIDAATQKLTQLSTDLADKESQVAESVAKLTAEAAQWEAERQACEAELKAAEAHVAPQIMAVYRKVRSRYVDALAHVEAGICGGCRMKITPQLHIEIQRANTVCQCPSCHRVLCPVEKTAEPA